MHNYSHDIDATGGEGIHCPSLMVWNCGGSCKATTLVILESHKGQAGSGWQISVINKINKIGVLK